MRVLAGQADHVALNGVDRRSGACICAGGMGRGGGTRASRRSPAFRPAAGGGWRRRPGTGRILGRRLAAGSWPCRGSRRPGGRSGGRPVGVFSPLSLGCV